jgi:predicted ATP-grasp superfamily ATP-dependent carboligase
MLVPKTIVARSAAEIAKAAETFGYPFVIKPGRSKYMRGDSLASTGVRVVHSAGELEQVVPTLSWLGEIPCLAQEFVPGHGAGVFCLMDGSKAVAWFAHRRLREKPPGGGVSVLSESAPLDPALQESARQLLTSVGWFGPAMVEYRIDPQGKAYLMEVNGRFWGSLQLAIDSGIDFPWLLCQVLAGPDTTSPARVASRARLRWLLGDLDRLIILLRDRSYSSSAKLRNVGSFIATCFDLSCRQEIFRWRDPAPAFKELRQWLGALR